MAGKDDAASGSDDGGRRTELDSRFWVVVVAALRSKQLLHGASPRIAPDSLRRRNTSIALEEVKQGLVAFYTTGEEQKGAGGAGSGRP